AVPKGTGRSRAGRGTKRLLGDGSRGKDKRGDEPQGCPSRRALGAGKSRSYEASRPFCRLGILSGDVLAGFTLRRADAAQKFGIHDRGDSYGSAGCRRQHCGFYRIQYARAETTACAESSGSCASGTMVRERRIRGQSVCLLLSGILELPRSQPLSEGGDRRELASSGPRDAANRITERQDTRRGSDFKLT